MRFTLQFPWKMKDISWFVSVCSSNGLTVSENQAAKFEAYRRLLVDWNRRINLMSRKDEENFYPKHAINCISFLFKSNLKPGAKILDLGTGGGLPGIPLKILNPDLNLCLVDSIAKKTTAVSSISGELDLANVEVVTGRAEELAKTDEFKGQFDYVISRAAGKLGELAKWSRGFLKGAEVRIGSTIPAGTLIVLKGGELTDELKHARNLKFVESISVDEITFDGMDELDNKDKKLVVVEYRKADASVWRIN
ncbi:MAG: 16S rRNA (guanine(527)-N(7))-methyltransferase RsmG [Bacteroidetes bacterium]|nr:16S rRNA (guanine(527)-N(7))-methyltransferase RsmG [Bacteroidota bacterium]